MLPRVNQPSSWLSLILWLESMCESDFALFSLILLTYYLHSAIVFDITALIGNANNKNMKKDS
jgi:hypothetical protein